MSWWSNLFSKAELSSPPPWLVPYLQSRPGQSVIKSDAYAIVVSHGTDRVIFVTKSWVDHVRRSRANAPQSVVTVSAALAAAGIAPDEGNKYMDLAPLLIAEIQGVPSWLLLESPAPKLWSGKCHTVHLPGLAHANSPPSR